MDELIKQHVEEVVKNNKIVAFIRGSQDAPRCGFSARVIRTLKELNQPIYSEDMDSVPGLWPTLTEMNDWRTSPQIFINGEFVGGCDNVIEMHRNGELAKLLEGSNS